MVRIPGPGDVVTLLQQQAEAFAQLPSTLAGVERTMRSLVVAVTSAQETAVALQRTAVRADRMLTELEEPISALVPGLHRLAAVLDSDVVDTIPATLQVISDEVVPVMSSFAETQQRIARIAASTERLTTLVDEVQSGLGTLPGASLLSRVRGPWSSGPSSSGSGQGQGAAAAREEKATEEKATEAKATEAAAAEVAEEQAVEARRAEQSAEDA